MRAHLALVIGLALSIAACKGARPRGAFYDVRDYGAVGDGKTKNTEAIRRAIAAATAHGGGTVLFTGGDYLTGPIHVASNLTLHIDAGTRLKFSQDFDDYLPLVRIRSEGTVYTDAPPEPLSERTPRFRDIHMSAITADAGQAALLLGLEESLLEDVSISNVNIRAQRGFVVKDARNLRLHSVHVDTVAGPAFSIERAEALDLFDVGTQTPHPRTAVVDLATVKNAHLHGCLAAPSTDVFARIAGVPSGEVTLNGNNLSQAKTPIASSAPPPTRRTNPHDPPSNDRRGIPSQTANAHRALERDHPLRALRLPLGPLPIRKRRRSGPCHGCCGA